MGATYHLSYIDNWEFAILRGGILPHNCQLPLLGSAEGCETCNWNPIPSNKPKPCKAPGLTTLLLESFSAMRGPAESADIPCYAQICRNCQNLLSLCLVQEQLLVSATGCACTQSSGWYSSVLQLGPEQIPVLFSVSPRSKAAAGFVCLLFQSSHDLKQTWISAAT